MSPWITAALLLGGLGFFAFTVHRRLAPLAALRPVDRTDRRRERLAALLRFGFGQRRLLDPEELVPGVLHALLFAAFLVLALRTVTLFGMGFDPAFHLPGARAGVRAGPRLPPPEGPRRLGGRGRRARVPVAAARHEAAAADAVLGGDARPGVHPRPDGDGDRLRPRRRGVGDRPRELLAPPRPRPRVPVLPAVRKALPRRHRAPERLPARAPARLGGAAPARSRGRERQLRDGHRRRSLLEGGARRLQLHGVWPVPDELPDARHGQAAQPEGGEPRAQAPPHRARAGARGARPCEGRRCAGGGARRAAARRGRGDRAGHVLGVHHLWLVRDGLSGPHRERAAPGGPAAPGGARRRRDAGRGGPGVQEPRDAGEPLGHRLEPPRRLVRGPRRPARRGRRRVRVPLLRRVRRLVRRPAEEGLARHRPHPARGERQLRHPRGGGDVHRRRRAAPRQRVPLPAAGAGERRDLRATSREEGAGAVSPLPERDQERAPAVRRPLRGRAPHAAHRRAREGGEAPPRGARSPRRRGHLPGPLLPRPPQRRVRGAACGARRGGRSRRPRWRAAAAPASAAARAAGACGSRRSSARA